MAFFKFLCHRNEFASGRSATTSSNSKESESLNHNNSIGQTNDESREMEPSAQHHPIVARYVSLVSSKRRFSVKNVFRRVEPTNLILSDSLPSVPIWADSSQTSLPLIQPLSFDLLSRSKSTMFPPMSELKTVSTQSNIIGAACTDISQSQSSCSYRLKKDNKRKFSDTYALKMKTEQNVSRNEYLSTNSSSESRHRAPSESQQRSSRQILKTLLEFPTNLSERSDTDIKLDKFVRGKHDRSSRLSYKSWNKRYGKLNLGKRANHFDLAKYSSVSSVIQTETKSVDVEAQTDTNLWDLEFIDSNHRSVSVYTAYTENAQDDLPNCECLKRANSLCDDRKKAFLNYKREYHQFLANETQSKKSVESTHSSTGIAPKTSAKGEEQSRMTTKRNKSSSTTTGCVLCDANFPSHTKDAENHIVCSRGDVFNRRYIVMEERGRGTFGKVFECVDVSAPQRMVAIKVVRATKKYSNSARIEASILRYIQKKDRYNTQPIIRLISAFLHCDHICLVFPLMGPSLYAYMKMSKMPFGLDNIKSFAYQILKAVKFLHKIGLTHTDLKPENVLLVNPNMTLCAQRKREVMDTRICVIDLGSATFHFEKQPSLISTRHYRAPEVVLQLGWSYSCDIWSVGCILLELYSGYVFFRTHDNQEHLQLMERALGRFPMGMVKNTKTGYFLKGFVKDCGKQRVSNFLPLDAHMKNNNPDTSRFRHLLRQLLNLDPTKRITADAACRLSFFSNVRTNSSPSPTSDCRSNISHSPTPPSRSHQMSHSLTSCKDTSAPSINNDQRETNNVTRWGCGNCNNTKHIMHHTGIRRTKGIVKKVKPTNALAKTDASTNVGYDRNMSLVSSPTKTPKPIEKKSNMSDVSSDSPEPTYDLNFVVSPKLELDSETRALTDDDESEVEEKVTEIFTCEAGDTCQPRF